MQSTAEEGTCFLIPHGSWADVLKDLQMAVEECLRGMRQQDVINRIWQHDHTVWKDEPTDIANRLGWLHSPDAMLEKIVDLTAFADEIRKEGFNQAILCGMGGSSLAPEVYYKTFGARGRYLDVKILDSTDPEAVLDVTRSINPTTTLFIISTKSGRTVETISFMKYFYNKTLDIAGARTAGKHFVAITDPGSNLESIAKELGFRRTFLNDPNIGGRYSALSYFGLVPAALIGLDLNVLLSRAQQMARNSITDKNSCLWLGTAIGESVEAGRDKVTLITSPTIRHFGAWVEQLLAESTGKEGKGILPVDGETTLDPASYAGDRIFVYLRLKGEDDHGRDVQRLVDAGHPVIQLDLGDLYDIGGEFFRWEMATAVAAHRIRINPFDQPNVESAKNRAREMVAAYQKNGSLPESTPTLDTNEIKVYSQFAVNSLEDALKQFLALANPGEDGIRGRSYVAIQAYVKPARETDKALQTLRTTIQKKYRLAVTVGYGPRFLHSTGQLHKGDAGHGLFIQFTADIPEDIAIPDEAGTDKSSITFGVLKNAQAMGDRQALLENGRRIIRFHLSENVPAGIEKLNSLLMQN